MIVLVHQTEGHAAGRDHWPPFPRFTRETRAECNQMFDLGLVGYLEVEVNPWSIITDLLVDVRITVLGLKAPKLWVSGPWIAKLPAQCPRPELR
jgi:hypothetical protein